MLKGIKFSLKKQFGDLMKNVTTVRSKCMQSKPQKLANLSPSLNLSYNEIPWGRKQAIIYNF